MNKITRLVFQPTVNVILLILFAILSIATVFYLSLGVSNFDLSDLLQAFSQFTVTVAIGLGTLAIAIRTPEHAKIQLVNEILTIIMISVFSFLLSYTSFYLVQRVYIVLSGLVLVSVLVMTAKHILVDTENNRDNKEDSVKSKRNKKKK